MGDDKQVILLAFELQNDRFKSYSQIMIRLLTVSNNQAIHTVMLANLCSRVSMMIRVLFVFSNLIGIFLADFFFGHLLTHARI